MDAPSASGIRARLPQVTLKMTGYKDLQEPADKVIDRIKAIGTVSKTSGSAIKAARDAYNALSEEQKALVPADVLQALIDAEAAYAALTASTGNTGSNVGPAKNPYQTDNKSDAKTDSKTNGKDVKSGNTGDAGVTLYVGMGLVAVLAGAVVITRKRKEN